ncbi:MAG: zinc ABC transporter substrate-binding protein [Pirellulales bacterium]|nr:zinc ABC transporter substrate-binding protein [Pirellulales bacterium]
MRVTQATWLCSRSALPATIDNRLASSELGGAGHLGLWLGVLLLAAVAAPGCRDDGTASDAPSSRRHPLRITTTCGMVTDIVRIIAGPRANVTGLMGEGVDPHLYKPTRNDVKRLMEADIVFYSGLLLEGRMTDTLTKVATAGRPVIAVTAALDEQYLREPPEFAGHPDPHVWMDVAAWSQCVAHVGESLAAFDPEFAEEYRVRAAEYRQELGALEQYARDVIATVPESQRALVTAHDAFGYFSRAYAIPVRSVQGLSTESEAGVDDINRLVDFLVTQRIPAIFVESSVSEKNIRAVIEGAASRGAKVAIGGQLYSDAMGAPGTYEGTYLGMIDHNATTIARALGGTAPERGRLGRLSVATPTPSALGASP